MLLALHFSRILLRQSRTAALTSLDQELVKRGWWYRKYAPGEMVLERLGKEVREARKGLRTDPQQMPQWVLRKT
jgi:endonuclease YncB( thermonuclease family)